MRYPVLPLHIPGPTVDDLDAGWSVAQIVERARSQIDFNLVRDGHTIPVEVLEEITGLDRRLARYGLAVVSIRDAIIAAQKDQEKHLRARQIKGSLEFLTPAQQATFSAATFLRRRRQLVAEQRQALKVDVSQLTGLERQGHEKRLTAQAAEIAALRLANGRIRAPEAPTEYLDDRPKRF